MDLLSIQKLAIDNGFKVVGISDPNYVFWIDEYLGLHSSVKFFTAVEKTFNIGNESVKVYIYFRDAQSLFKFGRKSVNSLKDLKYLNCVVFYAGTNKEHFSYIYDIFLGNTGFAFTNSNLHLLDFVLSKVDFLLPFHYSTIPPELEDYSDLLKKFIPKPSPFLTISKFIKEIESLPQVAIDKLNYTVESIVNLREFDFTLPKKNDFSELLWKKLVSKADEKVKSEFLKIKEVRLDDFFYKLANSLEEFVQCEHFNSDILSSSFIMEKLGIVKINKRKVISFEYFLDEKPLYIDVRTNSVPKLKEILLSNFGEDLFYRVYPVHISEGIIDKKLSNLNLELREFLKKYLKKVVVDFRVSKKLFFSKSILRQNIGCKDGINKEFCGKSYDCVIDIKKSHYIYSRGVKTDNIFSLVKDDLFISPDVFSHFWGDVKDGVKCESFHDLLRMFYLGYVLSKKPYLKFLVDEMIKEGIPIFVEDFLPQNPSKELVEDFIEFLSLRDKKNRYIVGIDLFRLLVDNGVDVPKARQITESLGKYKNVIGIKSLIVPRFYDFLASVSFFSMNKSLFISSALTEILKHNSKVVNEVVRKLISCGFAVNLPDINKSKMLSVDVRGNNIFLPLFVCRVSSHFLRDLIKERKNGKFRNFFEFYARIGKNYPRDASKLVKCGAFDTTDDRESILRLTKSFSELNKKFILVSEEIRNMGFSVSLFYLGFDSVRRELNVGSIRDIREGKVSKSLGFILYVDNYSNLFVGDDTGTMFVRNSVYLNLKVGDWGLFTFDVREGVLGKNFYLKFFERI